MNKGYKIPKQRTVPQPSIQLTYPLSKMPPFEDSQETDHSHFASFAKKSYEVHMNEITVQLTEISLFSRASSLGTFSILPGPRFELIAFTIS